MTTIKNCFGRLRSQVFLIPALSGNNNPPPQVSLFQYQPADNYIFLAALEHDRHKPPFVVCVDPGDADPVLSLLGSTATEYDGMPKHIDAIFNTHEHWDHSDGIPRLAEKMSVGSVFGPSRSPLKTVTHRLDEGKYGAGWTNNGSLTEEGVSSFPFRVHVLDIPGHTIDHICFHLPDHGIAFVGDTLFPLGCGRLFGGTAAQLHTSLTKLAAHLPETTLLFSAHEYALGNAKFATHLNPECPDLKARVRNITLARDKGKPTVPTTMLEETSTNPFLRCNLPQYRSALGLPLTATDQQVFTAMRRLKDTF